MRQQRRNLVTSGALDPSSLPNLELQLRGTSLVGATDDPISTFSDTSGKGRHATQAGAKRPRISGVNANNPLSPTGKTGASFNFGEADNLDGAMADVGVAAGNTFYLWFHESQFGGNDQVIYNDDTGGKPQLIVADATGKIAWRDGSTHSSAVQIKGDDAFHSLVYVFSPPSGGAGTATIYHNGAVIFTDTWNYTTAGVSAYTVGANQVDGAPFAGTLFETDYFSQEHSPEIVARVLSWGVGFWGF